MKKTSITFTLIFTIFLSLNAASAGCDKACQKRAIEEYFDRLAAVFRADSDDKDLENLFSLFDASVKYEHVEYSANFNKAQWLRAFKRNHERGAYNKKKEDHMRVEKFIFGKTHVAVSYSYGETSAKGEKNSWKPKGDQDLLALFGFADDKIVLVREYW